MEASDGFMRMDQVRLLLRSERERAQELLRRERVVCFGSVLIMGAALVGVCWGLA